MVGEADGQRRDDAQAWLARTGDPEFDDWSGHAVWLEADPRNASAYYEGFLLIEDAIREMRQVGDSPKSLRTANNNHRSPLGRKAFVGAALALAAGVLALIYAPGPGEPPALRNIETAPGQPRTVRLADGSIADLNGATKIRTDAWNPRRVVLDKGEAFIVAVHDTRRPFELVAGGRRFRDVGTAFDVVQADGTTTMEVQEGSVAFDPAGRNILIKAGRSIEVSDQGIVLRRSSPGAAGSWRNHRLVYSGAPLRKVAADLTRTVGLPVAMSSKIEDRVFSGVIAIDQDTRTTMRNFADLVGEPVRKTAAGWWVGPL